MGSETSRSLLSALLLWAVLPASAVAAEADFIGKWLIALDHRPGVRYGTLEIVEADGGLEGYVDGGPVDVSIDGDRISFPFDWEDGGGLHHVTRVQGMLADGAITGEMRQDGETTGSWRAEPREQVPGLGEPPRPVDLSGIWDMQSYDGTAKYTFDMTERAEAFQEGFDPRLDDPALRCVSDGLVRVTGGPFAKEIIEQEDHITILYEDMHEVRRIYTDGRDFPDNVDDLHASMGYSIGHWEGSTLVVETRGLKEAIWHRTGTPISAEARITEYMHIDEDGNLRVELVLDDPLNYDRPPLRHTVWAPDDDYEFTHYACDPHAFYRGLHLQERLEEYFGRSEYRR